jgi:hypothetical protein
MASLKKVRERRQRERRQRALVAAAKLPHARTTDNRNSHESAAITEATTLISDVDKVAEAVRAAGKRGLTLGELEDGKYWRRFSDARKEGLIFAIEEPRWSPKTKRNQTVYVAKEWKP